MIAMVLAAQMVAAPGGAPAADSLPAFTLAEALDRGLALNPDYVRALGQVAEAEWARKMARVAFFLPSVGASLEYTRYSTDFFNIGTLTPSNTSATARLTASYELLSVRKFAELGRTQAELDQAAAGEVERRFGAALLTESAYYGALAAEELARVGRDRTARAEAQLRAARARVVSGAAVQSDSLTVRLELLRAMTEQLRLESEVRVTRLEFGRRVGIAGPARAVEADSAPPGPLSIELGEAITRAIDQGPEYRSARARERAAAATLRARRGAYLPTLSLSAAHTRFDVQLFPSARRVSSLTFTLSLPIWNGGERELAIRQARTSFDAARAIREDLERAALRDVTEAWDGYQTSRAGVALASEALAVARENYRVQDARYRGGAGTVLDLLQAQAGLSEAEAQLVQARYAARLALARLEAMLGARLMSMNGGRP